MPRRYVGVNAAGNPMEIFERVRRVVQMQKQTQMIPVVKFERKLQRGSRGQFYVLLAVENKEGMTLPDEVATVLEYAGLRGQPLWPIEPASVKPMTGGAELETHSLNALKYEPLWSNDMGDPFDLSDAPSHEEDVDDSSLGKRYTQLLNWLSANAEGTWQTFARVCDVLQLANDIKGARSIFRRLILLGYIESSSDGQKWSICPTTLVQCATEPEVCFLAGQQTPNLIKQLREHWEIENTLQPSYRGPPCVKVHSNLSTNPIVDGFQVESVGVVSIQLASLLPDLEGWKTTLTVIDRINTAHYSIEIWDGSRFSPCDTFYERDGQYFGESGMYRLKRGKDADTYQIVLYFDQPNQRWLRGDWYGLRFLAYDSIGRDFEVTYDSSTNDLLIPLDERWPLLYERALVLASGSLPSRPENPRWLKYSGVSSELVQLLTEKLSVSIREI